MPIWWTTATSLTKPLASCIHIHVVCDCCVKTKAKMLDASLRKCRPGQCQRTYRKHSTGMNLFIIDFNYIPFLKTKEIWPSLLTSARGMLSPSINFSSDTKKMLLRVNSTSVHFSRGTLLVFCFVLQKNRKRWIQPSIETQAIINSQLFCTECAFSRDAHVTLFKCLQS